MTNKRWSKTSRTRFADSLGQKRFDEMTGCLTEDLFLQTPSVPPGQLYLGWGLFPKKLWTVVGDMEQCRFVCPSVWFQTHHV